MERTRAFTSQTRIRTRNIHYAITISCNHKAVTTRAWCIYGIWLSSSVLIFFQHNNGQLSALRRPSICHTGCRDVMPSADVTSPRHVWQVNVHVGRGSEMVTKLMDVQYAVISMTFSEFTTTDIGRQSRTSFNDFFNTLYFRYCLRSSTCPTWATSYQELVRNFMSARSQF